VHNSRGFDFATLGNSTEAIRQYVLVSGRAGNGFLFGRDRAKSAELESRSR
jgi:hypothetical protein